jgi:hypothetical protein
MGHGAKFTVDLHQIWDATIWRENKLVALSEMRKPPPQRVRLVTASYANSNIIRKMQLQMVATIPRTC